jgi:hypothetical protein
MSKKIICPYCGNSNWTGSLYCDKCSANLISNTKKNKKLNFIF